MSEFEPHESSETHEPSESNQARFVEHIRELSGLAEQFSLDDAIQYAETLYLLTGRSTEALHTLFQEQGIVGSKARETTSEQDEQVESAAMWAEAYRTSLYNAIYARRDKNLPVPYEEIRQIVSDMKELSRLEPDEAMMGTLFLLHAYEIENPEALLSSAIEQQTNGVEQTED